MTVKELKHLLATVPDCETVIVETKDGKLDEAIRAYYCNYYDAASNLKEQALVITAADALFSMVEEEK